eukprot:2075925-Amphidinium_carterae.1
MLDEFYVCRRAACVAWQSQRLWLESRVPVVAHVPAPPRVSVRCPLRVILQRGATGATGCQTLPDM